MKILTTLCAVIWTLGFIGYVFGCYDPSPLVVGYALLYLAFDFTLMAVRAHKERT
ncbi:hypothetical protein [Paenibacillus sp. FSL R7-0128]|uniref:hypothetical protein n=1 Tax=Paenibacillus sp. FSL R7-0128 TaxID=2954529 RepID=UPI0030FCE489